MKIVFMGTPDAAAVSLERLLADGHDVVAVYTQPDRPSGRGKKITESPVKRIARERAIPVFQPARLRTEEAASTFSAHRADVTVVVAFGRILPEAFLDAFPFGAVNVHFSLLPKYRGAAPVNWAIVHGESETGVTIMKMNSGLDTGDILLQRSTSISPDETAIDLMNRLAHIGADMISDALFNWDELTPRPQNDEESTYAPMMKKEDGLIDWSMSAFDISNRIRGFQPFPTSYTFLNGKRLTIWRASGEIGGAVTLPPGSVTEAHDDTLAIACGGHTRLLVKDLQPEGKQRMATRDFLNGFKLNPGMLLGENNIRISAGERG